MSKTLYVVGVGPGCPEGMTLEARKILSGVQVIAGYTVYIDMVRQYCPTARVIATGMRQEVQRCEMALQAASGGETTAMVCSGDAGVYGMASPILEMAEAFPGVKIIIIPGVTAALSGAALLGAPLGHDFAVISMSDLLTPMALIERRLRMAAQADLVICLYNPESRQRAGYLARACRILLEYRAEDTVCGVVRQIGREEESCEVMTLKALSVMKADMFTTVFIGSSQTRRTSDGRMVTPRGYRADKRALAAGGTGTPRILIFGGTTEGRQLSEFCARRGIPAYVSVFSEYGKSMLTPGDTIRVLEGDMDQAQMENFIREQKIELVIDATHPFAVHVSDHASKACKACGVKLIRCLREEGRPDCGVDGNDVRLVRVRSAEEAADFLSGTAGNIFLTIGSHELSVFAGRAELKSRLTARVLPSPEAIGLCVSAGLDGRHIIAMQGPFSREMNICQMRECRASWLVTKESGKAGGVDEKLSASAEEGVGVVMIARPGAEGHNLEGKSVEDICRMLDAEDVKAVAEPEKAEDKAELYLIGAGPGSAGQMTREAIQRLSEADVIFGAQRMLDILQNGGAAAGRPAFSLYRPVDILDCMEEHPGWRKAAVVYSGDTGFHSGAFGMRREAERRGGRYACTVWPGISSLSYFCARAGIVMDEALLSSVHGREADFRALDMAGERTIFFLLGKETDAARICRRLTEAGKGGLQVVLGEKLSYPEERIRRCLAREAADCTHDALAVLAVLAKASGVSPVKENQRPREGVPYPGIVLAAPRSGSGKTVITCGLLRLLSKKQIALCSFKCGPDYLDPMFHRQVIGIPGANLDGFFMDADQLRGHYARTMEEHRAGLGVVEGVMGFYDGSAVADTSDSTWDIAQRLGLPVILVVDGKGAAATISAEIQGMLHYRKPSGIAAVILNRVKPATAEALIPHIEAECGIPVLGAVPPDENFRLESRHLGLTMPGEVDHFREKIDNLAKTLERHLDVGRLLEIAGYRPGQRAALPDDAADDQADRAAGKSVRIGVALDEAFSFYYQENLSLLKKLGAELIFFSPLHDRHLPADIHGILLGGGYPELHAGELEKNAAMRREILAAWQAQMPVLAECGGFMYLHQGLRTADGRRYEMAGAIEGDTFYAGHLVRFGYAALETGKGVRLKAHEFHYWDSENPGMDYLAVKPSGKSWRCIHDSGSGQVAGYPHIYYPSAPEWIEEWMNLCRTWKSGKENRAQSRSK